MALYLRSTILLFIVCSFSLKNAHAGEFCYNEEPECDVSHWEGACLTGKKQSPIDLVVDTTVVPKQTKTVVENQRYCSKQQFKLKNNGHTVSTSIRMDLTSTSFISGSLLGGSYVFSQMHFHWSQDDEAGSEHTLNGRKFPMEGHLVHFSTKYSSLNEAVASNQKGALAVLGVFFEIQEQDNPALTPIIDHFKEIKDQNSNSSGKQLVLHKLLPWDKSNPIIQYEGSLTTPGCNEIVLWNVFSRPEGISRTQLTELRSLQSHYGRGIVNYRPVQDLNNRVLKVYNVKVMCQDDKKHEKKKPVAG